MTDTYPKNAPMNVKMYEELRCVRCVLERLLMTLDGTNFKDYQLEKFSGNWKKRRALEKERDKK